MKKTNEILDFIRENPQRKVKVAIVDIDGILRGKYMDSEKFISAVESGFGFCDVVFGWDSSDVAYDNSRITGWHTGYPDALAGIDLNTFRVIPWEDDVPFFLADFSHKDSTAKDVCPRNLLKNIIKSCEDEGFKAYFSQEFEWFNFAETPEEAAEKGYRNLRPLTPGMFGYSILRTSQNSDFFHDLFDQLSQFDIPLEGLHTETGPGVLEAAIQYADILESADRAVLFKTAVKEIGYRHGILPTFMAKISENLPGCSGHVHQSLWDSSSKKNLFHDSKGKYGMSKIMESYMAGQLYCLPYILPMVAPTVNSYKRLVEGAWAPTTLTWARDNRTTALRALPGGTKSTRLETRVVGSDTNPYLAMAACLASGLYGIRKGLKLKAAETIGSGYKNTTNGILPSNLLHASEAMKNSEVASELFGETFVTHYTASREWEWRQFSRVVTDWETKRYLEII
jgi:glutamine synthetase